MRQPLSTHMQENNCTTFELCPLVSVEYKFEGIVLFVLFVLFEVLFLSRF